MLDVNLSLKTPIIPLKTIVCATFRCFGVPIVIDLNNFLNFTNWLVLDVNLSLKIPIISLKNNNLSYFYVYL